MGVENTEKERQLWGGGVHLEGLVLCGGGVDRKAQTVWTHSHGSDVGSVPPYPVPAPQKRF